MKNYSVVYESGVTGRRTTFNYDDLESADAFYNECIVSCEKRGYSRIISLYENRYHSLISTITVNPIKIIKM